MVCSNYVVDVNAKVYDYVVDVNSKVYDYVVLLLYFIVLISIFIKIRIWQYWGWVWFIMVDKILLILARFWIVPNILFKNMYED